MRPDMSSLELIRPDWPAPPAVRACSTTRRGGASAGAWEGFNLADHVGDDPRAVAENRALLAAALQLPAPPRWLQQVHGCEVAGADWQAGCAADACFADRPDVVCAVLTADCLPILLCNRAGSRVAAVHAGWRGLAAGIVERTLQAFTDPPGDILAWLGPAIGPAAFEVGEEVRAAFVAHHAAAATAFRPTRPGHWLADLYALARSRLAMRGVHQVWGGAFCTYNDADRFYSYRRDGVTGRMATLIWLGAQ
jgi:YfiH family protein